MRYADEDQELNMVLKFARLIMDDDRYQNITFRQFLNTHYIRDCSRGTHVERKKAYHIGDTVFFMASTFQGGVKRSGYIVDMNDGGDYIIRYTHRVNEKGDNTQYPRQIINETVSYAQIIGINEDNYIHNVETHEENTLVFKLMDEMGMSREEAEESAREWEREKMLRREIYT